jgi:hypothetical protein
VVCPAIHLAGAGRRDRLGLDGWHRHKPEPDPTAAARVRVDLTESLVRSLRRTIDQP